jgi:2-deoxy-D-gluconate 3-dehydrogenase
MPSFRMDSQIALVTNACAGVGAAIAVALAEAGADVAVHAETRCPDETCANVRRAGRRAIPITGDLSNTSEPARLVADALGACGRLDVLVSIDCAASLEHSHDDLQHEAAWDHLVATRLSSTYRLCRAFGGYLLDAGRSGRIVNVAAPRGRPGDAGHAAATGGLLHLTRALAREWAPRGIAVNAIVPGALRGAETPPPALAESHRWGTAEDLAGAAVFLASPAARFVNGQVLVIDGAFVPA